MFADQYIIVARRKHFRFDMRPLKQAMRDVGVPMQPLEEKAEALCDAISDLLNAALEQAYTEIRIDSGWED